MNIQSLSVCVPALRCINDCKFCCSKMHSADYKDCYTDIERYPDYMKNLKKRLQYARDNGCNTLMLTGNNEPQQNKEFLRILAEANNSIQNPFLNIEMQTSGAFINDALLDFLKNVVGVTTVAISVACCDNDELNRSMIQTPDENLNIARLSEMVRERNMNLRICLNMNDDIIINNDDADSYVQYITNRCRDVFFANQLTFRALWSSESGTPQSDWIAEHVTDKTYKIIEDLKADIKKRGVYLDTLEYGADRYDYEGMSVVIDEDSMSKAENKNAVKYLILRPDGHLYSKWDSKASLIF